MDIYKTYRLDKGITLPMSPALKQEQEISPVVEMMEVDVHGTSDIYHHPTEYDEVRREHVAGHGNSTLRAGRSSHPGEPQGVLRWVCVRRRGGLWRRKSPRVMAVRRGVPSTTYGWTRDNALQCVRRLSRNQSTRGDVAGWFNDVSGIDQTVIFTSQATQSTTGAQGTRTRPR